MPKPMQSNIAVLGVGAGVLTFVARDRQLSSNAIIAAVAEPGAQGFNLPSANENEPESDFWEHPLKVAGLALRRP
jgi:hypothetical protein